TGADGQFGAQVPAVRGTDVTRYKQHWETFFGHFLRADDGRHYVVAGKGWHGIHRIEGLAAIRSETFPVEVPAASVPVNAALRALRARRVDTAKRPPGPRSLDIPDAEQRAPGLRIDGRLSEWGGAKKLEAIDHVDGPHAIGLAWTGRGLALAVAGRCPVGHAAGAPERAASDGFAIELSLRPDGRQRSAGIAQGDRRLIMHPQPGGGWRVVRVDWWDPAVAAERQQRVPTPWGDLQASRISVLDPAAVRIGFELGQLDLESLDKAPAAVDVPEELRLGDPSGGVVDGDAPSWSFEAEIPWEALGLPGRPGAVRADLAVIEGDASGTRSARRATWAEVPLPPSGEAGYDLRPRPGEWGSWNFR
ncbi:MAG: hypothetical protein RLZZ127_2375, partial [Planctomycetota bacterium]